MNNLTLKLTEIGVNTESATIYTYLLSNGSRTALQISKDTNINRNTVYRRLEDLQQMGLAEEILDENTRYFAARDPENIKNLLTEQEHKYEQLRSQIPHVINSLKQIELVSQSPTQTKVFKGKDGIKNVLWNLLKCKQKLVLGLGYLEWYTIVGKKFADKLTEELHARRISTRELSNTPEDGRVWSSNLIYVNNFYKNRYISPDILKIKMDTYIYDDVVAFIHFIDNEYFGIEIKNKEIASVQRQLYYLAWEQGIPMKPFEVFVPPKHNS